MAAVSLTPEDLAPFATIDRAKALAMIEDATALAATVAPCIVQDTFTQDGAARAILRGAILRWNDAGSGAVTSESIGDYSYTTDSRTTQGRRGMFWPSEIEQLQRLCRESSAGAAFSIDQVPATAGDSLASRPDLWFQYVFPVPPSAP